MSIRFENVHRHFGERRVLNGVSFELKPGEIAFILGKSGVGKSVTLKHIVGLLQPTSGKVFVDSDEVSQLSERDLAAIRRKCGMVFQHPALFDSLTVLENVAFGLDKALGEEEKKSRVLQKLRLVNLGQEILHRYPPELSFGMQKRVSLARTLAPEPRYLLFDEPTTGLDPITTNAINDLIRELSRKLQVTSLVVSHDMEGALNVADRILVVDSGKILADGPPEEIRKSSEPLIRDFLLEVKEAST